MAISLVTSVTAGPGSGGGATGAIDTTGANLLVISAHWWTGGGAGTITVSDSKGNTWTPLTAHIGNDIRHRFYYCLSPTSVGSGHTFTVSGTATYPAIIVYAYAGVGSYQTENGAGAGSIVTGTLSTGSVTPSINGALVLTGYSPNPTPTISGPTISTAGFTQTTKAEVAGVNFTGATAYQVQATAAAVNPTWIWSTATGLNAAASVAVFLPVVPTAARLSQLPVEVLLGSQPLPSLRLSGLPIEILRSSAAAVVPVWLSQLPIEILRQGVPGIPDTAITGATRTSTTQLYPMTVEYVVGIATTQLVVETLNPIARSPVSATQVGAETLDASVNEARVTLLACELLVTTFDCEAVAVDFPIDPE